MRILFFVRSHWEDESAKLGDNFVIDAYVAVQNEEALRRAKALYAMRRGGKNSSSSSKVRDRLAPRSPVCVFIVRQGGNGKSAGKSKSRNNKGKAKGNGKGKKRSAPASWDPYGGKDLSSRKCYLCGEYGHLKENCPKA